MRCILSKGETHYALVAVPKDVVATIGRLELIASLKTRDYREACKIVPPILADFHARIARARSGTATPDRRRSVQIALVNWTLKVIERERRSQHRTPTRRIGHRALKRDDRLERWLIANPPIAEKERGRLEHNFRQLTKFVGDIPANQLTKAQIEAFMAIIARFQARSEATNWRYYPCSNLWNASSS